MLIRFGIDETRLQLILLSPLGAHVIEDAKNALAHERPNHDWEGFVCTRQMHPPRD